MPKRAVRTAVLAAALSACGESTAPIVYTSPLDLSGACTTLIIYYIIL